MLFCIMVWGLSPFKKTTVFFLTLDLFTRMTMKTFNQAKQASFTFTLLLVLFVTSYKASAKRFSKTRNCTARVWTSNVKPIGCHRVCSHVAHLDHVRPHGLKVEHQVLTWELYPQTRLQGEAPVSLIHLYDTSILNPNLA